MEQKTRSWNYVVYKKDGKYFDMSVAMKTSIRPEDLSEIDWSVRATFVVNGENRQITNDNPEVLPVGATCLSFPTNTYCAEGLKFVNRCKRIASENRISYMTDFELFPIESLKILSQFNIELSEINSEKFNYVFGTKTSPDFFFSNKITGKFVDQPQDDKFLQFPLTINISERKTFSSLSEIKKMSNIKLREREIYEKKNYEKSKKTKTIQTEIEKLELEKDNLENLISLERKIYTSLNFKLKDTGESVQNMINNTINDSSGLTVDENASKDILEKEALTKLKNNGEFIYLEEEKRKLLMSISDNNISRKKKESALAEIKKKIFELKETLKSL